MVEDRGKGGGERENEETCVCSSYNMYKNSRLSRGTIGGGKIDILDCGFIYSCDDIGLPVSRVPTKLHAYD